MAINKPPKVSNSPEAPPVTAPFIKSLMDSSSKKFGRKNFYAGGEHEKHVFGLSMDNNIPLQFLFDSNVLILQSIITLSGPAKTYKTSAGLYFLNCFLSGQIDGGAILVHTEGKMSPTKISSMLGRNFDRIFLSPADSIDGENGWQKVATHVIQNVRTSVDEIAALKTKAERAESAALIKPIGIVIDSLTGAQSQRMADTIFEEGAAPGKTYQDRAAVITQWLNTIGSKLTGYPITLFLINHLKASMEGHGSYNPGGVAPGFHTSLDIRIKKTGEIKKSKYEGASLAWTSHFSSIGKDQRTVNVDFIETYDDNGNQVSYFDWDRTLVMLLIELSGSSMFPALSGPGRVVSVVAKDGGSMGTLAACPEAGVTVEEAKEKGITPSQLGRIIHKNKELSDKIRKALFIQQHAVWSPECLFPGSV